MTPDGAALRHEQRAVARRMVAAVIATVGALSAALTLGHGSAADRWQAAAVAAMTAGIWLAAAIGNVARLRFFSAQDIAGSASGTASAPVLQGNAVVQNTLEQVVLAALAYLAVAAVLDRAVAVLTTLAVLFSVGRALFWLGQGGGARKRALGFALTFYPTVAALLVVAATLVGRTI